MYLIEQLLIRCTIEFILSRRYAGKCLEVRDILTSASALASASLLKSLAIRIGLQEGRKTVEIAKDRHRLGEYRQADTRLTIFQCGDGFLAAPTLMAIATWKRFQQSLVQRIFCPGRASVSRLASVSRTDNGNAVPLRAQQLHFRILKGTNSKRLCPWSL